MVNYIWENIFKRDARERDLSKTLAQNILFRTLSKRELHFIKNIVHEREYRAGEVIFRQSEVGVGMYIIVKGIVNISVTSDDHLTPDSTESKEILVTRLESGDFFGELSLVEDNGARSASATAAEDTTLIGFFKPDLLEVLERSPATGVKVVFRLAEVLGRRLKETTEKITQLRRELKLYKASKEQVE